MCVFNDIHCQVSSPIVVVLTWLVMSTMVVVAVVVVVGSCCCYVLQKKKRLKVWKKCPILLVNNRQQLSDHVCWMQWLMNLQPDHPHSGGGEEPPPLQYTTSSQLGMIRINNNDQKPVVIITGVALAILHAYRFLSAQAQICEIFCLRIIIVQTQWACFCIRRPSNSESYS